MSEKRDPRALASEIAGEFLAAARKEIQQQYGIVPDITDRMVSAQADRIAQVYVALLEHQDCQEELDLAEQQIAIDKERVAIDREHLVIERQMSDLAHSGEDA